MAERILKNKLSLLATGCILGILIYLGPSIILSLLILWGIYTFLGKRPKNERKILTRIILVALALRLIFFSITIFIVYCGNTDVPKYLDKIVGHTVQVIKDFDREIKNGINIARYLKGELGNIPIKEVSHGGHGFLHAGAWTQGILNYIFGISIFNLLIFPLIDLWTIIVLYYLAKLLFDEKVGAFSSFVYAVLPSTIIIACTNIRFSLGIFSLLLIALSILKFAKAKDFKYLFAFIAGSILFMLFKDKAGKPLLIILPFLLFMAFDIRLRRKVLILGVSTVCFSILLTKSTVFQKKSVEILQNIVASQTGFVTEVEGYRNYKIYDEIVYSTDVKNLHPFTLVKMLPKGFLKGVVYFMLVPFPWDMTNIARLYYYPQVIFWYFIIPLGIFGMIRSVVLRVKGVFPIILLCGYFIVLLSLVLGNEGIATRYRELITPFFYIFAGSILCKLLFPTENKDYKLR